MTKGSRRIAVDDADVSRIQYFGDWTTDNGDHDAFSVWYGPTYEHTQHGTVADGASFSFLFNGTCLCKGYESNADLSQALPFKSLARGTRTGMKLYPPGSVSLMVFTLRVWALAHHQPIRISSVGMII